jgi:hypothetical protein
MLVRCAVAVVMGKKGHKKRVSYLYRAATTKYPCFGQDLGDSMGAGRIGLTLPQRYIFLFRYKRMKLIFAIRPLYLSL